MDATGWYPDPGKYLALAKEAFAVTAAGGKVKLFWSSAELDAAAWRAEFVKALNKRINLKAGLDVKLGRKDDPSWFWAAMRTAHDVNTPRLRVYASTVPKELRAKLAHRLVDNRED